MVDYPANDGTALPDVVPLSSSTFQQDQADDELVVEYHNKRIDLLDDTIRYWGGVIAHYGPTTIECEELFLDRKAKTGRAVGKVHITDPEGTFDASNIIFNYVDRTGVAEDVSVILDGASFRAKRLEISKTDSGKSVWTLLEMRATPSRTHPPEFTLTARRVVLTPGGHGKANWPGLEMWGQKVLKFPFVTFSLDNRVSGFRIPALAFKRGQGFGVAWSSTFLLNESTSFGAKLNAIPKSLPNWSIETAGTSIDPERFTGKLMARPDLLDRLSDSYLDSVMVPFKEREWLALKEPRSMWSAGTYWNVETRGRATDLTTISKRVDVAFEVGGQVGRAGAMAQLRLQSLRPDHLAPFRERAQLNAVGHTGFFPVGKDLVTFGRVDLSEFVGPTTYGWARGAVGLQWSPNTHMSITASAISTVEHGSPQYVFDEPFWKRGFSVRFDGSLGPLSLSALSKYDTSKRAWVDSEYSVGLVAGSFEPYFTYGQYPKTLQFGVRIRAIGLVDRLSRRQIKREKGSSN